MHDLTKKEILHYKTKPGGSTTPSGNIQPRKQNTARSLVMPPDPEEQDLLRQHSFKSARFCEIHEHCFRCFKGTSGQHGCAMAVPRGLKEGTGPVELEDTTPKDASADEVQYSIRETIRDSGDPSVVRDNVEPLDSVDRRIICWETRRPTLDKLPDLDKTLDDEECRNNVLEILRSAMEINLRPQAHSSSSSVILGTAPERIVTNLKEQGLSVYNPRKDSNGFFRAVAVGMHVLGKELKSVGELRGELMDHLASKVDSPINNSSTTFGDMVRRESNMSTEQYMLEMRDDTPHKCKAGGRVETVLLQSLYKVNVAVYKQDINDCRSDDNGIEDKRKFSLSINDSVYAGDTSCGTVPLVDTELGHYKLICPSSFHPDRYLYSMNHEEIDATMTDLSSLQTSDLKELYERVSDSLPDRNGWVAEFNLVLMAVMGCNTNSILLGCEEQSKSAAFYIGEMCNLIVTQ